MVSLFEQFGYDLTRHFYNHTAQRARQKINQRIRSDHWALWCKEIFSSKLLVNDIARNPMCSSLTELEDNERSKVDEVLDRINRRMGTWLVIFARLRISLGILAGDPARVLRLYRDLKT